MSNLEFVWNLRNVDTGVVIQIIELSFIIIFSYYCFNKISSANKKISTSDIIIITFSVPIIVLIVEYVKIYTDVYCKWLCLIFLITLTNYLLFKENITYSFSMTIIAFSTNYVLFIISVMMAFIPNAIFKIKNDYMNLCIIIFLYCILVTKFFKVNKIKNGFIFLKNKLKNSYIFILVLNIGAMTIFAFITLQSYAGLGAGKIGMSVLIVVLSMLLTIKQSFEFYYKQNLLVKDLEQTKAELEVKKQEVEKLEKENLEFSKTSHSLAHKQKSLEYKLEQLMKTGVDTQSKEVIKQEIQNISKEVYKEPQRIQLPKTEIESIDDMFLYMQSECIKDNIKFELQVLGNIFYMINNLILENELEILIADHIKDAIIAIDNSNNINRSILVRIGKIDNVYALYIYDSGIEFEKEVLENLGKKPITTHADSGGTGMGFMNTFDTLKRTKASLIINEIGKPCIDNYTKVLIFKFDNKNEFIVNSYKNEVVVV